MSSQMFSHTGPVVLGLDERPIEAQETAVRFAAMEANRRHAAIVLAHGCQPLTTATSLEPTDSAVDRERSGIELLAAGAKVLRHHLDRARPIEIRLGQGTGVDLLLELSASAGLIVLQRRDIGTFKRWHTGSTTSKVAAEAQCPVVIVRSDHDETLDRSGVVVGVDERGHAGLAVETAFAEASLRQTSLVATHAWQMADLPLTYGYVPPDREEIETLHQQAEVELAEALAGVGASYPDVAVRREVVLGAAQVALDAASEKAELLIIGRHGTGRMAGLALGSVARHAISSAPCPVMIVPPASPGHARRPRWLASEVPVSAGF
ncbi:MAG TPA: universal stress protein [Microlunatus sp.]|nr:universal stress protein [Microlunatus sp.]